MDHADAGSREVFEAADPFRVAGTDEDDERSPVDDAPMRKRPPAPGGHDAGFRQPERVELE